MKLEEVFTVHVIPADPITLNDNCGNTVIMIPFTGSVTGKYFEGRVLSGGVDTQIIGKHGRHTLSARYMLEGKDYKGNSCKIFIENNGNIDNKKKNKLFFSKSLLLNKFFNKYNSSVYTIGHNLFHCSYNCNILFKTQPKIITDSGALYFLMKNLCVGEGIPLEGGVDIKIYGVLP